jgi:hypothetical protein
MSFLDFVKKISQKRNTYDNPEGKLAPEHTGVPQQSVESLWYPSDLWTEGNEPYILFHVRDAVARDAPFKKAIALYMPPTITVNHGAEYQEMEFGITKLINFWKDMASEAKNIQGGANWKDVAFGETGKNVLAQGIGNLTDYTLGDYNVGKKLEQYFGRTKNPHASLTFEGVKFRTFTFDFLLMARNEAESESIKEIIKAFKHAMHPAVGDDGSTRFWKYPDNFDIFLLSPNNKYLFHILTSALVDMNVDYTATGNGVPSFFGDTGAPVAVKISLTFKELALLDKDRIDQGY